MATAAPPDLGETVAELLAHLGDISPSRIRLRPPAGAATEADLIATNAKENCICELIDGVLVEKTVGIRESVLAALLAHFLLEFVRRDNLGIVAGADGMVRLESGQVRVPDVAFYRMDRLTVSVMNFPPVLDVCPDLAIEVLSTSNTKREMSRKLEEYFAAGTQLVWYVDPETLTVRVYIEPSNFTTLGIGDSLDGGNVLPGFVLPLNQLFSLQVDQTRSQA